MNLEEILSEGMSNKMENVILLLEAITIRRNENREYVNVNPKMVLPHNRLIISRK